MAAIDKGGPAGCAFEPVKEPVAGTCPECAGGDMRAYPVLAADGWFEVVKCQQCLATLSKVPWHRMGWLSVAGRGS